MHNHMVVHNHMSMHMELNEEHNAINDECDVMCFFFLMIFFIFLFFYKHDEYAWLMSCTICLLPMEYDDMLIALSVHYLDDDWRYVLV